jgi:hypothetical protein
MNQLSNLHIAYHRNGIGGEGFYVVTFNYRESRVTGTHHMVATVFETPGTVSVLDVDMLTQDNIAFAGGNSWRGDVFEAELRQAITAWEADRTQGTQGCRTGEEGVLARRNQGCTGDH